MKRIFALALNEFRVEFSERSTIIFFFILPFLFTAIVGVGLGTLGTEPAPEDPRIPVAVVDKDQDTLSEILRSFLGESDTIRTLELPRDEAEQLLENNQVTALLTLPESLTEKLLAGNDLPLVLKMNVSSSGSMVVYEEIRSAAARAGGIALAAGRNLDYAETSSPFPDKQSRDLYMQEFLTLSQDQLADPPLTVRKEVSGEVELNIVPGGFNQSSPGQVVTWTLITFLGTAIVLVDERRMGTLRRLLTMPASRATILAGKLLGRLSMGLLQMLVLIVCGAVIFNVNWGSSPAALSLVALSFGLAATALGLFLATLVKSPRQAESLRTILAMVLAALGGGWWPLEITPRLYQDVVRFLPSTWAMRGFSDVIMRGQGVQGVLLESGVLLGFALLFFVLGVFRFRYE